MGDKDPITLARVIAKVKKIADEEFDGKLYDNVMAIFNELSVRERIIFLRGLMHFCSIIEMTVLNQVNDKAQESPFSPNEMTSALECEVNVIERANAQEMAKLNTWFIKFGTVAATVGFVLVTSVLAFVGNDSFDVFKVLESAIEFVKIIAS